MNTLLAPNGEPSNLTPEQYKLVRTLAFKEWFGDWENDPANASKVIDSNGEPLLVYHGTEKEFNIFSSHYIAENTGNLGFLGVGFYFATNKSDAKNYGEIVKPYFLNSLKKLDLRNIQYKELAFLLPNLLMTNGKTWKDAFIELDKIKDQIKSIEIEDLKNGFFNVHYEYKGSWETINKRTIHEIESDKGMSNIVNKIIKENPNDIGAIGNYFNTQKLTEEIKNKGFDSVMDNGTNIYDLGDEIVVFKPDQIKLADGTNTTFDANNDDIRFNNGGNVLLSPNGKPSNLTPEQYKLVRTPAFNKWFGDWENSPETSSKVVDSNGEPLVVYHETNNEFNVFDFNKADIGFHFGTFTQAKNRLETKLFFKGSKSNISMFFLNIKSIYQVADIGDWEYPQRYLDMFMSDNIISESEFKKNGFQFLNYKEDNKKIRDFLIKKYNNTIGFEYNNKYEDKGKSYIVIHSNQIKLADGSNTTFDENNDDIRFNNGGNVLLAPNGKPSKLTPEQYKLVRTPAFKNWFGDWENDPENSSKIVDTNGEPLEVYHGTDAEFNVFDGGAYFTDDYMNADGYAGGENVFHIFLNIKKPLIFNANRRKWDNLNSKYGSSTQEIVYNLDKKKYDGVIFNNINDNWWDDKGSPQNVYYAINPEQIKLSDGSNTTFDGNNPDIRFNEGGSVDNKYQYVVDEIENAIIGLGLPHLNEVDEFNRYYLSKSKNDFGQSWYMIFLQENRPLEIRISDHSVTSSSRIMDDKYIAMLDVNNPFKYTTAKGIAKSLDLEFKRLKDIREKRNKLFDDEREKRNYMNNELQSFLDKLKSENKTIGKNERTYQTLEEVTKKHPDWEYIFHYPNNGAYSFYFVKNDTSGSLSPNFINEQYFNFLNDNNYLKTNYKTGGSVLLAPNEEQIKIKWSELSDSVKNDIVGNVWDNNRYVQENYWNSDSLKDAINDLIKNYQPLFKIEYKNTNNLYNQLIELNWDISEKNIENLIEKIEDGIVLDPVILNNGLFFDGGHRLTSYKRLKIEKIPTIDIGFMLDFNYEKWDNGEIDFNSDTNFKRGGRTIAQTPAPKKDQINVALIIEPNERIQWNGYKIGDIIDGSKLDELSGDLVGNDNNKYILVQQDLSIYPYSRQYLIDLEPDYQEEENWRIESMKQNFFKTPPIPKDGDGMHRIISAKELGHKTILMWKEYHSNNNLKTGGRTIAQTPAPIKDQIKGSDKNKEGSAKDISSAKKIKFSDDVLEKIQNKVDAHNKKHSDKKITIDSAKAVVRRGMGAYSSTHRPTISGGNQNSRVAWGLARLNAFLFKIVNGKSKSGKYSQDNDLIKELGYKVEKYSDGGDIQAYEEAMGVSEFKEGGETKPKKVYVSIQLPYELEKIEGDAFAFYNSNYFYRHNEKPFQELKNGILKGVVGVSSSPNNIAEWFIHRDCLIVMNYDEFIEINETETIDYYDSYQLMKNNLYLFRRLYANVSRYGEQKDAIVQTLIKILEKIIPEINLEINLAEGQKYNELYRISQFLSPYVTRVFPEWIEKNSIKIESPIDLTNAILDFNKLNDNASYIGYGFENPVLTFDELLPIVEKGITNASSVYYSEQEIVLTNRELNIPKNSQLFFVGKNELGVINESNLLELIEKYELKSLYKINFINRKEIEKYRAIWLKKEEEKFNIKLETGKESLELKKEQVVNEILNTFIDKSINSFKIEYEKDYLSEYSELKTYYDNESDDYEEIFWYDIDLVQFIINTYIEIIKVNWKRFIESRSVKDLNLYSFSNFCSEVEYQLKDFFEQNKDKLEKISDYRESKGNGYLSLYGFEQLLKKSVNHYETVPEWFDYKKLSKLYLEKMGGEIYRYYDKKDLPLISQYKDGGKIDVPTKFWGTEAGGVLVYCSTTERYLILLRSQSVLEPNTWGVISGKLDDDETNIEDAVLREVEEEVGYKLNNLIPSFIFEKTNFKFHNFVAIINEEFIPELNWENTDYKWVKLNEMPDNLHFGLKLLIQKEDIPKLVKKNKMENEILIVDMNMYFNNTSVNFKNTEIPLKLNEPKEQDDFIDWAEKNNIEFEQWGDFWDAQSDLIDTSYGYTFEIPLFKYIEYLRTEKFDKGGELKKGIKTEMEHKETISKIKTGKFSVKKGVEMIAKDHIKENDKYYTNLSKMESEFKEAGGKVLSIHSDKGDIKINLDENWYSDDTNVQLVPVSELIKFREFDRKVSPKYNQENSKDNINHLKYMFQKEGVKSPLIIEYSPKENSVLIIEGNHRLNSAIDLGMEFLPARVVLKKYGTYSPEKLKSTMKVSGVTADESGYISSDLKPSQVGIEGTMPIYADGGIIEGRLHSECGDDGCGRKFQVGENGHVIEAERDEAVIVADAFDDNEDYTIKGTPSEVASAINVMGGGKNFDTGATIIKKGQELEIPELKKQATDTDVADVIDSGSIIINRRSMADEKEYEVTGTPKQIASAINSINGNGVIIEKGAEIKEN